MIKSKVGIVLVTYNRLALLQKGIEALRKQTYLNFQIIVVNNGSTDKTLEWLEQQSDIITITQENCGGAGGFHTGMKYVAGHSEFKYCWIMDDDVICNYDALEQLVIGIEQDNNIGFVCSRVVGEDGVTIMNVPKIDTSISENGYPNWLKLGHKNLIKIKHATFVSVLIPTELICKIGLPYKEYFIWGDDVEYTLRLSSRYNCYVCTKSTVMHMRKIQESLSFFKETNDSRLNFYYYRFRNELNNEKKFGTNYTYIKRIFGIIFKHLLRSMLTFDLKRTKIVIRALYSCISFNPKIDYPLHKNYYN